MMMGQPPPMMLPHPMMAPQLPWTYPPHMNQPMMYTQTSALHGQNFAFSTGHQCPVNPNAFTVPPADPRQPLAPAVALQDDGVCVPRGNSGSADMPQVQPTELITEADDNQKLSTSYRVLGLMWKHGTRATIPKKIRGASIIRSNPVEWTVFRMAQLDEEQTDALLFVCSGVRPSTRIADLGTKTKGELKNAIAREAARVQKAQPERLSGTAHDLKNIILEALRLGYDLMDLPPTVREKYSRNTPLARQPLAIEDTPALPNVAEPPLVEELLSTHAQKRRRLSVKTLSEQQAVGQGGPQQSALAITDAGVGAGNISASSTAPPPSSEAIGNGQEPPSKATSTRTRKNN